MSKAGIGMVIVTILEAVLPMMGIEVPKGTAAGAVESVFVFIGFILMIYGQFDRGDLDWGLFRRG